MEKYEEITMELCRFISGSPTSFHTVSSMVKMLEAAGFSRLSENAPWKLEYGRNYYVSRADSSVIAFCLPDARPDSLKIIASHSDSPSFKIKDDPEIEKDQHYIELNIEQYGGALMAPWFDRPLGVAGRVIIRQEDVIQSVLVDSCADLLMIPSLAIHMNRKANEGGGMKIQSDMLPLFGDGTSKGKFIRAAADWANVSADCIIGTDLFLYDRSRPSIWGINREFFSSPRIDDLQCAYSSVKAITQYASACCSSGGSRSTGINMCCIFDNEEVGSSTKQGADSTFLRDTIQRICLSLDITGQEFLTMLSSGFMLSADNSHAVHPNHMDKADPVNRPYMNEGVVIKFNASQKYTTDALSAGIFRTICAKAGVPVQTYFNNSDIPGGSTLGNISSSHVSVNSVDIGCAQLAMHSPYETAGTKDTLYMIQAMEAFYSTDIRFREDGSCIV